MKTYGHVERRRGDEIYDSQLIKWLIERGYIPENKKIKILDLASGKGNFYRALKNMGYENVSACDLFPKFKECKKEDLVKGLSYKKESFDLIISRDVAEHILRSEDFFDEQYRVLKRRGIIIVMTPNAEKMTLGQFYDDYTHVRPFTRKSLYEALNWHGFEKVKVKRVRAIPRLWRYTIRAFDFLFSRRKNNLLGAGIKK